LNFLKNNGILLSLVKPQFELSPEKVRKGIVRKVEYKEEAIRRVVKCIKEEGLYIKGIIKAFPRGSKGNEEFFVWAERQKPDINIDNEIGRAINE